MPQLRHIFALILIALASATIVTAQDAASVSLTPAQPELAIGDVTTLTLEVTHPAGWRVIAPELEAQWGPFEVRDQSLPTIRATGTGTEITALTIDVALFDIGAFETPRLAVRVVDTNGVVTTVNTPPTTLTVTPLRAAEDGALRDLKPQAAMLLPMISPLVLLAFALAVAAVAVVVSLVRKRAASRAAIDNRTPYQIAYDELLALDTRNLLQAGDHKQHYASVAAILRQLFEQVYAFPATECTTAEMRRVLRDVAASEEQAQFACALLSECDVVKFSSDAPMPEDAYTLSARARQLVLIMEPTLTLARSVHLESAA